MINIIRFLLLVGVIWGIAAQPATAQFQLEVSIPPGPSHSFEDQIIVQLKPNQSIAAVNATFGTSTLGGNASRALFLLEAPPQASPQVTQAWLTNDHRVAWAEMNNPVIAPHGGTQSFFLFATHQDYTDQPGVHLIQADAQWWTGGRGQIVAVLDTGLDPEHPVLARHIAPGGYNYIDDNHDYREIANGQTNDYFGHGTMVSGLVLRAAPHVRILPMRVLNSDGVGSSFAIAMAIHDAVDEGATVINASLGTLRPSRAIAEAAYKAMDQGVVVVAAAGNRNRVEPALYPAALEGVIAVAGTDLNDQKASFSDYGGYIDISAPAVSLAGPFPGNAYAFSDGNSLATPLVSATAALIRSSNPSLSPEEIRLQLHATADEIDSVNPGYEGLLGAGRLNVFRALSEASVVQEPAPRRR